MRLLMFRIDQSKFMLFNETIKNQSLSFHTSSVFRNTGIFVKPSDVSRWKTPFFSTRRTPALQASLGNQAQTGLSIEIINKTRGSIGSKAQANAGNQLKAAILEKLQFGKITILDVALKDNIWHLLYTRCKQMKVKVRCCEFECRVDIHFKNQPEPAAKNSTPSYKY